ncbi:MAG: EF-P lysine aminoacylase EpmA [Thermodesulfobacteriota bacterium]
MTPRYLEQRARILQAVRAFFYARGYLEVDTPIRLPGPAPEAHIDAVASEDWYLQTSPELCMKRLLAAGHPRIFQICKCFRKGERGERHLTEFTLLEWYTAGVEYIHMMAQCEDLIRWAARKAGHGDRLRYGDETIDLCTPWLRMTVREAFERFSPIPLDEALAADRFDEIIALEIEPRLEKRKPVFLYDYPAAAGALARLKPSDPTVAERFELYIAGIELCNAFSELIDPQEQRTRFEAELANRRKTGRPVYPLPEKFLEALPHMPEAAGNALGLDRLVMLLTDAPNIDRVVAFPPEAL